VLSSLGEKLWSTGHCFGVKLQQEFRGVTSRAGVLFQGPSGWGEFSPFTDYSDQRAALWLQAAIEAAYMPVVEPVGARIPVNAIIGDNEDVRSATRRAIEEFGCTTIKVKLGCDLESNRKKLDVIVETAGEQSGLDRPVSIRVDINGRWTLEQAITACKEMVSYPIEYVEQPCADQESLQQLHRQVDIPIAVDESIRIDRHASVREFADIAIVKVSPLGGLRAVHAVAESVGVPVRVSGALETSVGLFPSLLAAWQLAPDHAAGLGTGALFATDVVPIITVPHAGVLPVRRCEPDPQLLVASDLPSQENEYWFQRFSAAFAYLPQECLALLKSSL
jgi:o-succinylbenzoate synthase